MILKRQYRRAFRLLLWIPLLLSISLLAKEPGDCCLETDIKVTEQIELSRSLETFFINHNSSRVSHQISWIIISQSEAKHLNPLLMTALVLTESGGHIKALGSHGERGLTQISKIWWGKFPDCGKNLWNPKTNICYGASVLNVYITQRGGIKEGINSYNGGGIQVPEYVAKIHRILGIVYLTLYEYPQGEK